MIAAFLSGTLLGSQRGTAQGAFPAGLGGTALAGPVASAVSIRYQTVEMAGLLDGGSSVHPEALVQGASAPYVAAMTRASSWRMSATVQVGISRRVALRATVPFVNHTMHAVTGTGGSFRLFAKGIEDFGVNASLVAIDRPRGRLWVQLGGSLPTGSISRTHTFPTPEGERPQLPYNMQPGAGVPGLGLAVEAVHDAGLASLGTRAAWTGFLGRNGHGWTPGDCTVLAGWIAFPLAPELGLNVRGSWQRWGDVRGRDSSPTLLLSSMPAAHPELQGGSRGDLAFGVGWLVDARRGIRFAAEYITPLHQDLHGPQLSRDWSMVVAAEIALGS